MSNQVLEVHSTLIELIAGLTRSKSLCSEIKILVFLLSHLLCCAITHQIRGGRAEGMELRWMWLMFREHVVWLRETHIKRCGFRKPPVEKQDASLVRSAALWGCCCSEGSPAQIWTRLSVSWDKQYKRHVLEKHLEPLLNGKAGWAPDITGRKRVVLVPWDDFCCELKQCKKIN